MPAEMHRLFPIIAPLLVLVSTLVAQEVQQHGLVFEKWVRDTFFDGYVPPGYTQQWDIPGENNKTHGAIRLIPRRPNTARPSISATRCASSTSTKLSSS